MSKITNKTRVTKGVIVADRDGKRKAVPIGPGQTIDTKTHGGELYDDHPVIQEWLDKGDIVVDETPAKEADDANGNGEDGDDAGDSGKPAGRAPSRRRR